MVTHEQPNALDIHAFLRRRARDMFAEDAPPDRIEITRHQSVWLALCRFRGRVHNAVVKWFGVTTGLGELRQLCYVHEHLRQAQPPLRSSMVGFLSCDHDSGLVALEKVDGVHLEQLARTALPLVFGSDSSAIARCDRAMRQLGQYLRHIHSFDTASLKLQPGPDDTDELIAALQESWTLPGIARRLPAGFRDPASLLDRVRGHLHARACDSLLPVDLQPKNVLITPDDRMCVIDIDYTLGHPAHSLGMVLASIDLTTIRHPDRQCLQLVEQWKASLLAAYSTDLNQQWILDDLQFFYPRAILALHRRHVALRPYWARSLNWYYGGILRRYLQRLN